MKPAILAFLVAIAGPAVWAQKYPKRPVTWTAPDGSARPLVRLGGRTANHNLHPRTTSSTPPPAPGVVQCYVDPSGFLTGAFLTTASIASGSTITGYIYLQDDGSYIDFTGETLQNTLSAPAYIQLPSVSNFSDLYTWFGADFSIVVQVVPPQGGSGTTSQASCTALVGESFQNSDLNNNAPLISGISQTLASNKDLDLILTGYFTSGTPSVVLTDLYSTYMVPASAVALSGGQITVDLSQISGFALSYSDPLYVTVSQAGYSDTIHYRYLPVQASGSYNPAPQ